MGMGGLDVDVDVDVCWDTLRTMVCDDCCIALLVRIQGPSWW